jgi:ribonuclease BN (tRNA processing enzyme)
LGGRPSQTSRRHGRRGYSRFGQSLAKTSDLALVAISHLHPDHVSDLPAFLWLSHQVRNEPLPIVGPSGNSVAGPAANDIAPDFPTFLARLFDEKNGAFQVLGGTLGGKGNGVRLNASVVDAKKAEPTTVFEGQGLKVTAMGIPHANMPTLAYRVETSNGSIVFSSDQNGTDPKFVDFARNANVLIMHLAIAAGAPPSPLHASPAVVGRIAQEAGVKRLILSHIGQFDLEAAIADVKKSYTGALTVGANLQCTRCSRRSGLRLPVGRRLLERETAVFGDDERSITEQVSRCSIRTLNSSGWVIRDRFGAREKSLCVRYAPLATAGQKNAACREGPEAEVGLLQNKLR